VARSRDDTSGSGGEEDASLLNKQYDGEIASLFEAHAGRLRGYLLNLGVDHGLVDDVVQDSFLATRAQWSHVRTYDKPQAYVYKVATRLAPRMQKQWRSYTQPHADPREMNQEAGESGADRETCLAVRAAIGCLAPRQRAAVHLHYLLSFTIEEVGAILRCTAGTVKSNLYDARRRLAELLETTPGEEGEYQ
jgi:RNA polymerase sigma-70 factor, ECF subfamily